MSTTDAGPAPTTDPGLVAAAAEPGAADVGRVLDDRSERASVPSGADVGRVLDDRSERASVPSGADVGRVLDDRSERIGRRIRGLRKARGLTLVQLAALTGLSHPFLSQLERGHARPSIVSLDRIAQALGSSQVELLASADAVQRAARFDAPSILRDGDGLRGPFSAGDARLLSPDSPAFEAMEVTGSNTDPGDYHAHDEDELICVIEGAVELDLGAGEITLLCAGDSAHYPGGTPHRWVTAGGVYRLFLVKAKAPVAPPSASRRRSRTAS